MATNPMEEARTETGRDQTFDIKATATPLKPPTVAAGGGDDKKNTIGATPRATSLTPGTNPSSGTRAPGIDINNNKLITMKIRAATGRGRPLTWAARGETDMSTGPRPHSQPPPLTLRQRSNKITRGH